MLRADKWQTLDSSNDRKTNLVNFAGCAIETSAGSERASSPVTWKHQDKCRAWLSLFSRSSVHAPCVLGDHCKCRHPGVLHSSVSASQGYQHLIMNPTTAFNLNVHSYGHPYLIFIYIWLRSYISISFLLTEIRKKSSLRMVSKLLCSEVEDMNHFLMLKS